MTKDKILTILGESDSITENDNQTALEVRISTENMDVTVTIPYDVYEMFFEAKDKDGKPLVKDWFDFCEGPRRDDFREELLAIVDIMKSPVLRVVNGGKTVEAKCSQWYYWFGNYDE